MRNIRPGSAKFFSKKKTRMLPEISVISARRPLISSIDRSVAEQPGIFSKPWVLGAKAGQRVCEYFHALSKSRRVHDFWINYTHVCAKENTKNSFWSVSGSTKATKKREKSIYSFCVPLNKKSPKLMMSVFCSNSLPHAPECGKCILRDPNFQNFPGEYAPTPP